MKIKLKIFQILLITRRPGDREDPGVLRRFLQVPLPTAVAWANRNRPEVVKTESEKFDTLLKELVSKHGGKAGEQIGQVVMFNFPPGGLEGYRQDENLLLDQEIDLPGTAVRVSDLPANSGLSATDLGILADAGLVVE